jgi:DNA-binding transcriptional ArsR family regulator
MAAKAKRQTKRRQQAQNLAKAMSNEHRVQALRILSERAASPSEVAEELGLDVRKLAYHIVRLKELGCIEKVGDRQVRGAVETFYRAIEMPLVHTDEWEEVPPERRASLVGEFFQAILDEGTRALEAGTVGQDDKFWVGPAPYTLDEQGLAELVALHDEQFEKAAEIQADFADRQAKGEAGEPMKVVSVTACFRAAPPEKP